VRGRTSDAPRYHPRVLELHGVGRTFRGRVALAELSFSARAGEAVAVLGDNGAGKTTALKIAVGELSPTRGKVVAAGGDPRSFAVRRRIGYVPEGDALEPFLSVDEAARYLLDLYGARRERGRDLPDVLARFGLAEARKRRVATLSKGQRRRLELARVRLVDPPLWVLDEPDSGLDPAGLRLLREEIRAACARGRAVVFSSHALMDVVVADRVIVLRAGRVAFDGTKADLSSRLDARGYVLKGGDAGAEAALRAAAARAGASLEGPELPVSELEAFLFGEAAVASTAAGAAAS
jgi:ABC-type multidrug transport system ATPase subunit